MLEVASDRVYIFIRRLSLLQLVCRGQRSNSKGLKGEFSCVLEVMLVWKREGNFLGKIDSLSSDAILEI